MEFCKDSDRVHRISIKTRLLALEWLQTEAVLSAPLHLQITCVFAGAGRELNITLWDARHKRIAKQTLAITQYRMRVELTHYATPRGHLIAQVDLADSDQRLVSNPLPVLASHPIIFDQRWQHAQATRRQRIKYLAQSRDINDGERVEVEVWVRLPNRLDTAVCGFTACVANNRIEQTWQFEFPLATQSLDFPYRPRQFTYQAPRLHSVSHVHGLRFVSEHFVAFEHDQIALRLARDCLHQCDVTLYSSDGEQRPLQLMGDQDTILSVSPGPCLLLLHLTHQALQQIADDLNDDSFDQLTLPHRLPLPHDLDYIDAPLPSQAWCCALNLHAPRFNENLMGNEAETGMRKQRVRFRESDGLLALAGNEDRPKHRWSYYQLAHNLLLPVNAIDATGAYYTGPAVAYVDNRGCIHPFYLSGQRDSYRFALYQVDNAYTLAIWSNSGQALNIDIPLLRLARAIRRLNNRRRWQSP